MAIREVQDEEGGTWMIYPVHPSRHEGRAGVADGFSAGWLCFQRGEDKWRHRGVPEGWDELGDVELLGLRAAADPAPRRSGP